MLSDEIDEERSGKVCRTMNATESPIVSGIKEERKVSLLCGGADWSSERSSYRVIEKAKEFLFLYAFKMFYYFDFDVFEAVNYFDFDVLEVLHDFDLAAGVLKGIHDFDVHVLKRINYLDLDILKRIYNLHFAIKVVGLAIFRDGATLLVYLGFTCKR